MHSIYIHIPFCNYKCDYCNFFVLQKDHPNFQDTLIQEYLGSLHKEIDSRKSKVDSKEIRTIYFGGGTPALIGANNIKAIIDHIGKIRSLEFLEELSIELNPDPFDETIALVKDISSSYKDFPRIRFSRGLQTFDDDILELSGRKYNFNNLKGYLRELQTIKQAHVCYNFDFIAFGTLEEKSFQTQGGRSWNKNKIEFYEDFVASHVADSFSIYMLELFPGSKRHKDNSQGAILNSQGNTTKEITQNIILKIENSELRIEKLKQCINPDDEKVLMEYDFLSETVMQAGYRRYEVSNYALPGKNSIHNTVYRTMQPYIGVGASASGFIQIKDDTEETVSKKLEAGSRKPEAMKRYTNTTILSDYIKGNYIDSHKTQVLSPDDLLYEEFMLGLRSYGISDISRFKSVLENNYLETLELYEKEGLIIFNNNSIKLTNDGLNVANRIISELLK